jgi:hypothetical protein
MATGQVLELRDIGPIGDAEVTIGDLTVLVGPQASGKSIFLQFLKLVLDSGPVTRELRKYGMEWEKDERLFLDLYFGEGMRGIWKKESRVKWRGAEQPMTRLMGTRARSAVPEKAFLIPAQRVLTFSHDAWIRPFSEYRAGDPFAVREFSEQLRRLLEVGLGSGGRLFPDPKRLKVEIKNLLAANVFGQFQLNLKADGPRKRLVLGQPGGGEVLPPMVWSAGQREFVPLLLGLYYLLPPAKMARRGGVQYALIEELEMGLHPRAISAMLVIVLELLWRGYRVVLSTHSPMVLEFIWAVQLLQRERAAARLILKLLECGESPGMKKVAEAAMGKEYRAYYFPGAGEGVKEITGLDPGDEDREIADWGGLTAMSSRVTAVLAEAMR